MERGGSALAVSLRVRAPSPQPSRRLSVRPGDEPVAAIPRGERGLFEVLALSPAAPATTRRLRARRAAGLRAPGGRGGCRANISSIASRKSGGRWGLSAVRPWVAAQRGKARMRFSSGTGFGVVVTIVRGLVAEAEAEHEIVPGGVGIGPLRQLVAPGIMVLRAAQFLGRVRRRKRGPRRPRGRGAGRGWRSSAALRRSGRRRAGRFRPRPSPGRPRRGWRRPERCGGDSAGTVRSLSPHCPATVPRAPLPRPIRRRRGSCRSRARRRSPRSARDRRSGPRRAPAARHAPATTIPPESRGGRGRGGR